MDNCSRTIDVHGQMSTKVTRHECLRNILFTFILLASIVTFFLWGVFFKNLFVAVLLIIGRCILHKSGLFKTLLFFNLKNRKLIIFQFIHHYLFIFMFIHSCAVHFSKRPFQTYFYPFLLIFDIIFNCSVLVSWSFPLLRSGMRPFTLTVQSSWPFIVPDRLHDRL